MKLKCRFNTTANCTGNGLCEFCHIPKLYGVFFCTDKRGKISHERRFILEADRNAIITACRKKIARLEKEIADTEAIPSKEAYESDKVIPGKKQLTFSDI